MELNEAVKLVLAFIIGAVIGLERERSVEKLQDINKEIYAPLGLRTFSLISTLGAIVGLMVAKFITLAILISSGLFIILIAYYIFHTIKTHDIGITTEISLIYSYIIGLLIALEVFPIQLTLAISVVVLVVLSRKTEIKNILGDIKNTELNAFTSFALIALVILPFLPNRSITFNDVPNLNEILVGFNLNLGQFSSVEIFNPFKLWLIVALITGVNLVGYVLSRSIGNKRGWILASIAGGFVSSTATTLTLAHKSKQHTSAINNYIAAAIFANLASFFQIGFLIAVLSAAFFAQSFLTISALIVSSTLLGFYFIKKSDGNEVAEDISKNTKEQGIINLVPALKFAVLFLAITLISKIALIFFGENGFLVTTALGSIVGLDAVIINTTQLVGSTVDYRVGVIALIIANAVNLTSKTIYSFVQGNREFAVKFGISMAFIIASSFVGLLV